MKDPACPSCGNPLAGLKCELCGHSSIPEWIRLWHDNQISMTFRDDVSPVTRDLFHGYFRNVLSPTGHPVAAYFPSDSSPLFVVKRDDDGWNAHATGGHRNKVLLDGSDLDASCGGIRDGSRLELFSGTEGGVVATFVFKFS